MMILFAGVIDASALKVVLRALGFEPRKEEVHIAAHLLQWLEVTISLSAF